MSDNNFIFRVKCFLVLLSIFFLDIIPYVPVWGLVSLYILRLRPGWFKHALDMIYEQPCPAIAPVSGHARSLFRLKCYLAVLLLCIVDTIPFVVGLAFLYLLVFRPCRFKQVIDRIYEPEIEPATAARQRLKGVAEDRRPESTKEPNEGLKINSL